MNQLPIFNKRANGTALLRIDGQAVTVFSKAPGSNFQKSGQTLRCSPETLSALMKELESEMFGTLPGNTENSRSMFIIHTKKRATRKDLSA